MKATFGAGCFWHVEQVFAKIPGVVSTAVGYAGGDLKDPSYDQVCTGNTGHAESVQVEYDPAKVSYEELLDVFWKTHDPTTLDRQGPDVGTQYRSWYLRMMKNSMKQLVPSKNALQNQRPSKLVRPRLSLQAYFTWQKQCYKTWCSEYGFY